MQALAADAEEVGGFLAAFGLAQGFFEEDEGNGC